MASPSNVKYKPADVSCTLSVTAPVVEDDTDTDVSTYNDIVYIEAKKINPNEEVEVPLLLKNSTTASGFTCTLVLPEGLSIVTDAEGYPDVVANNARFDAASHASCYGDFDASGNVAITCATTNATRYKLVGNSGAVATIKIKTDANLAEGTYPILLKNISIANEQATEIEQVRVSFTYGDNWKCSHIHGDVNGDGEVTMEDVTELIEIVLGRKK